MEKINQSPWLTQHVVKAELLRNDPFCLVDVGASGGIAPYWKIFGVLKAFGFEPLCAECTRLNADENKPENIVYFPYFVGSDSDEVSAESQSQYHARIWQRASCMRALELKKINYAQEYFNRGEEMVYTKDKTSLDRFFLNHSVETIDFIKIDTDGDDYKVLDGAQNILNEKQVLGVLIESQFHGKGSSTSNTFRNIDRFLTDKGFYLFDLEPCRYTKRALPGKFAHSIPAETISGQVLWGEALYLRDYVGGEQTEKLAPSKLLKLACLYELFALPDCSAEFLIKYRQVLEPMIDVDECLDLLVRNMGYYCSYSEYIEIFEKNFESFYPVAKTEIAIPTAKSDTVAGKLISKLKQMIARNLTSTL